MLKYSTSLATLFGRSVCPLFLASALVVAPGLANATDFVVDTDTSETNAAVGGGNEPVADGDTLTVEEGVTMTIDEDGAGLSVDGSGLAAGFISDVVITNNGTIITSGTAANLGNDTDLNGGNASGRRSFGYGDGISAWYATNAIVINNGTINVGDYDAAAMSLFYSDNSLNINNGVIELRYENAFGLFTSRSDAATMVNNGSIYSYSVQGTTMMRMVAFDSTAASLADAGTTGHLVVNNGLIQAWKSSFNTEINGMQLEGAYQVDTVLDTNDYADKDLHRYIADSAMYNYGTINIIATFPAGTSTYFREVAGMYVNAHDVDVYNYGNIYIGSIGIGMEMQGSGLRQYNYGNIIIDAFNAGVSTNEIAVGMESYMSRAIYDYGDPLIADDNDPDYVGPVDDIDRDNASSYRNKVVNAGLIQIGNGDGMSAGIATNGGSGHDIYNYGEIRTPNGWSILYGNDGELGVNGYNNTYLFDGSILVGDIILNMFAREYSRFHLGDGYNAALRFDVASDKFHVDPGFYDGTDTMIWPRIPNQNLITSPNGFALVGNMVYVVDLESYSQQDKAAWSLVSMIQDAVDDGASSRPPAGDFAFSGSATGLSENWVRAFGGWVREPGDGGVSVGDEITDERDGGYSGYSAGTIIGVNKPERSYFTGVAYSQLSSIDEMDNDTGYSTHTGTLFGGIATTLKERFDLSLTAGVSFNQTDRDIADNRVPDGIDTTTANYASVFLSPSLLVNGPWGSSLRLNYLGGWTPTHSYELSEGEKLEVQHRFSHIFGARFQMAHDVPKISETFPVRVRYGVEGSYANGQNIDSVVEDVPALPGILNNYNIRFNYQGLSTPYDDGFTARGFAALDFGPAFIEAGYNTDEQVSVSAGLKIRF